MQNLSFKWSRCIFTHKIKLQNSYENEKINRSYGVQLINCLAHFRWSDENHKIIIVKKVKFVEYTVDTAYATHVCITLSAIQWGHEQTRSCRRSISLPMITLSLSSLFYLIHFFLFYSMRAHRCGPCYFQYDRDRVRASER